MKFPRLYLLAIVLALIILVGCSNASPTANPTPTNTVASDSTGITSTQPAGIISQITCDQAYYLLQQNKVKELLFFKDNSGYPVDIQIRLKDRVGTSSLLDVFVQNVKDQTKCASRLLTQVEDMNRKLSPTEKIIVTNLKYQS